MTQSAPNSDPLLVDLKTAAELLGISRKNLWSRARSGEIPSLKVGARRLFSRVALTDWIAAQIAAQSVG